jgi:hypothetical protein
LASASAGSLKIAAQRRAGDNRQLVAFNDDAGLTTLAAADGDGDGKQRRNETRQRNKTIRKNGHAAQIVGSAAALRR